MIYYQAADRFKLVIYKKVQHDLSSRVNGPNINAGTERAIKRKEKSYDKQCLKSQGSKNIVVSARNLSS